MERPQPPRPPSPPRSRSRPHPDAINYAVAQSRSQTAPRGFAEMVMSKITKVTRNLSKKHEAIKRTKDLVSSGQALNEDQLAKASTRHDIQDTIHVLKNIQDYCASLLDNSNLPPEDQQVTEVGQSSATPDADEANSADTLVAQSSPTADSYISYATTLAMTPEQIIEQKFYRFLKITGGKSLPSNNFCWLEQCQMGSHNSNTIHMIYYHLEKYNKKLAMTLANEYGGLKENLKKAACRFLQENGVQENILANLELNIINLPNSHRPLRSLLSGTILKKVEVHTIGTICIPNEAGCRIFRAVLICMVKSFLSGLCWEGELQISDIEVKNGEEVIITKQGRLVSPDGIKKDLAGAADMLIPWYSEYGLPPYFKQLGEALRCIPKDVLANKVLLGRYFEFLIHSMALGRPLSRAQLETRIHEACKSYKYVDPVPLFKKLLSAADPVFDWRACVRKAKNPILKKVYYHEKKNQQMSVKENNDGGTAGKGKKGGEQMAAKGNGGDVQGSEGKQDEEAYNPSFESMVDFLRQTSVHGPDKTLSRSPGNEDALSEPQEREKGKCKGRQNIILLDELELISAKFLGDFLPDLVWFLLKHDAMNDMLETVWDEFKKSCGMSLQSS